MRGLVFPTLKGLQRLLYSSVPRQRWQLLVALLTFALIGLGAGLLIASHKISPSNSVVCDNCCPHDQFDNLAGRKFEEYMCIPPVDAVYTWVNGSDPGWLKKLALYEALEANKTDSSVNITMILEEGTTLNRFRDNEELKYSLRSLWRYAGWLRRIFVVTDGQIPNWLNLKHPRVEIVTHEQIFRDPGVLPVFSSPAIEANVHRIPGLSKKFVYLNDDVMFGAHVWPEDFFTPEYGQKVYFSWDVPRCNVGCADTWLGDGFCDRACNVSRCSFDFGDCANSTRRSAPSLGDSSSPYRGRTAPTFYCNDMCPSTWVGDRVCDAPCNVKDCAYDGTDCGLEALLEEIETVELNDTVLDTLVSNETFISKFGSLTVPCSVASLVLNLSDSFSAAPDWTPTEADFNNTFTIAQGTLSIPVKLLVLVFVTPERARSDTSDDACGTSRISVSGNYNNSVFVNLELMLDRPKAVVPNVTGAGAARANSTAIAEIFRELGNFTGTASAHRNPFQLSGLPKEHGAVERQDEVAGTVRAVLNGTTSGRRLFTNPSLHEAVMGWWSAFQEHLDSLRSPTALRRGRRLDVYGDSLIYVNMLFHHRFGVEARKVPAHMPHLVDRDVMEALQLTWKAEFEQTSSHRFRHPEDIQFAFAYFHWLIHTHGSGAVKGENAPKLDVRRYIELELDTNMDGVLSENEFRTLAAVAHGDTPPEAMVKELWSCCTLNDENATAVAFAGVMNCSVAVKGLQENARRPAAHAKMELTEVGFEMLGDDRNETLAKLDSLRARKPKFICVNDDMKNATDSVHGLLRSFLEAMFPLPSPAEVGGEKEPEVGWMEPLCFLLIVGACCWRCMPSCKRKQ